LGNVSLDCKFKAGSSDSDVSGFVAENVPSITLAALEKKLVRLRVFPNCEGEISISGLGYTILEVPFHQIFTTRGKRLNNTKAQMAEPTYAIDNTLKLTVTPPMPVLDVTFHAFPETMLSGQVQRARLEINNKGNCGLKNLKVKLSHPSFMCLGGSDLVEQPSYTDESNVGVLGAGSTLIIPLWIRGDRIGKHTFRFLFGYQSEDKRDKVGYRKLPYTMTTQVLPSLRINAFTRPSASVLKEFILGVEVENLQQNVDIRLRQITSLSPVWNISPVSTSNINESDVSLSGRQTTFMYYRFKRRNDLSVLKTDALPESVTTKSIERLITGYDRSHFLPPALNMSTSTVAL
ncbi:Trafficking protein particle complex 8, partial [Chytridiales sp. JEL 0842]